MSFIKSWLNDHAKDLTIEEQEYARFIQDYFQDMENKNVIIDQTLRQEAMAQQAPQEQMNAQAAQARQAEPTDWGAVAQANQNIMSQTQSIGGSYIIPYDSSYQRYGYYPPYYSLPQPDPHADANELLYSLRALPLESIKEIIVKEKVYNHLFEIFGYDVKKDPDLIKSFQYRNGYGNILLKNEKYQMDLDKYIEDGPVEELK
jgi:hypothetical protein